jgi:2',3'-cyclic-nucleotide 2'-phosphodiesterase / 3'-nucleotidase
MKLKSALSLIIAFFICCIFTLPVYSQTVSLKIIETSDVHGAVYPYDFVNEKESGGSLAQVYTYVEQQRKDTSQLVILLDNGDILQGDPASYYYNFIDTSDPHLFALVMNYMNYDAGTVGNHDIETGHPVYDRFRKQIDFPWLAANATNTNTGETYFQPYTIINRDGIKIAVLGMITPAIPQWLPPNIYSGIEFEDMVETAEKWVKIIKEKEHPDLLIGLFHSGVDYKYNGEMESTYKNENASKLVAEKVTGFDVVLVGHDHAGWNFKTVNPEGDSVLVVGPTSRARNVAVSNFKLTYNSQSGVWVKNDVNGEIVDMKNYTPDQSFLKTFDLQKQKIVQYVAEPVCVFQKSISTRDALFGPSDFVDIIHKFQLEVTGADVSFVSPLSYDATIDSGTIYVRDMFNLYRYENFLYTMKLSGKEIKDFLEFSYSNWLNQMADENDHLLRFKKNDDGSLKLSSKKKPELAGIYYNFSSAAGIKYEVDVSKPAGERVKIISMEDGAKFSLDNFYSVAINSYRGNGGGGHLTRGAGIPQEELTGRLINSSEKELRLLMMNWLRKQKNVSPEKINNWKIVPEEWWRKGLGKDFQLLFGN